MNTDEAKDVEVMSYPCPSLTSVDTSPLPVPNAPITVRLGTRDDIPFIDALQKANGKALGFLPTQALIGKIEKQEVLIAVGATLASPADRSAGTNDVDKSRDAGDASVAPTQRVGYVIFTDRYLKRDELGVIYQLCVSPAAQRTLVGATLIKAVFERSAYGCKLYCCWCAQDLAANKFWESLGFVPIAFRGGSATKSRIHIFWQKRIRTNDETTPWWFPAKTDGGAIREDRLVLPMGPGLHWSDPMPVLVAQESAKPQRAKRAAKVNSAPLPPPLPPRAVARFGPPGAAPIVVPVIEPIVAPTAIEKATAHAPSREPKRADPKLVAAARELRDRWLEQVNGQSPGAHPAMLPSGKYDVTRAIAGDVRVEVASPPALSNAEVKLLAA